MLSKCYLYFLYCDQTGACTLHIISLCICAYNQRSTGGGSALPNSVVLDREKISPITSETAWKHTKGCLSVVQNSIRAPLNVTNHFQNRRNLVFPRRGGGQHWCPTRACSGFLGTQRRFSHLPSSETGINSSWFLTPMVQSCIWLYLKSTLKTQIPSITICFNMHVLLVKCCVKPSAPLSQKGMRNNANDSEMWVMQSP